jgi:uncharacterized protein YjbI with pentapeptide repeats
VIPWIISLKRPMAKPNMPFAQKATWYENQCRRRQSPFFRLLDRSFGFRFLVAAVASFYLLAAVNRFENCQVDHAKDDCLTSSFYEIVSIGNVESFSIVAAGLVYIMEAGRRKEKEHQKKFEVIRAARNSGFKGHLGRIRALEDLAPDGLGQDDVDLHEIYLDGLRLPRSRWRGANFAGSLLRGADFRHTDLQRASFKNADLSGADLRGADLRNVIFSNSIMRNVDLRRAQLDGAIFLGADLVGVRSDEELDAAEHSQSLTS